MIYPLSTKEGIEKFRKRANALAKKGADAELKEAVKNHSDKQRKYFHLLVGEIAKDRGIDYEDCKEALILHLGYYSEVMGQRIREHTEKMNVKQYSRLIDDLFNWATDEGYVFQTLEEYRGEE